MTALVLDAGALIALERGDTDLSDRLRVAHRVGMDLRTNGAVVAQVWRDPLGRQATLAKFLRSVEIRAVDGDLGRVAGILAGRAGHGDAIDATVVAIAEAGDHILTSDPRDIGTLVVASGRMVHIVPC